jgi:hypothetical protein
MDSASTTFRSFGQIYAGDNFRVFVLLQSVDSDERNYNFLIRTYGHDFRLIDDFKLATWDEKNGQYCYGAINRDLIIERKCQDEETSDIMQITKDGKIVATSLHQP